MIMQASRNEHANPRPLYILGEHWFKGYPGVGMFTNKIGLVSAHPANVHRLLHDDRRLVLVFPEGQKGTRKLFWQRYKLRRLGLGGFVKTVIRAGYGAYTNEPTGNAISKSYNSNPRTNAAKPMPDTPIGRGRRSAGRAGCSARPGARRRRACHPANT